MTKQSMEYQRVALTRIRESSFNPRRHFDGHKFDELVGSVRVKGVIEPILLRPLGGKGEGKGVKKQKGPSTGSGQEEFEIVAGARRYRAACRVAADNGGPEGYLIPALVREMDDDEAFEIMSIENLCRADLSELEEAQGFKFYLDKKGPEAIQHLAEKTGIDARYIRRRVAVLSLPEEALEQWEKGTLKYGHLEQLLRLTDQSEVKQWVRDIREDKWDRYTVRSLKTAIDNKAIPLGCARFATSEAGCSTCQSNSDVQASLFDMEAVKGAQCHNAACFKQRQFDFLTANWKKTGYRKKHKTNGFIFDVDMSWNNINHINPGRIRSDCADCPFFVTSLTVRGTVVYDRVCIGEKGCFNKNERTPSLSGISSDEVEQKAERRSDLHGTMFREEFYKEQLPAKVEMILTETVPIKYAFGTDYVARAVRVKLFILIKKAGLRGWFKEMALPTDPDDYSSYISDKDIWEILLHWGLEQINKTFDSAMQGLIMETDFGAEARRLVADHLGISLQEEWRLTKEYLEKKTKAEIMAIAEEFKLFETKEAKAFLYEVLLKKRGKFDLLKKGEMIRVILESGVELAGVVPQEILGKSEVSEDEAEVIENKTSRNCNICDWWKRKGSSIKGVLIPGSYGKCTRPEGHCDPKSVRPGIGDQMSSSSAEATADREDGEERITPPDVCSQCGSETGIKIPRGDTPYCEDCGWPDEDFGQGEEEVETFVDGGDDLFGEDTKMGND
jgi:ParB family transcriptional regulator, chromosome partitioning protein